MRQNVFKRSYVRFKDWFLGVEEDADAQTSQYDDWGNLKDTMLSLKMPAGVWLSNKTPTTQSQWHNLIGDNEWSKVVPCGIDHLTGPLIPVLTLQITPLLSHIAVWAASNRRDGWTVMTAYDRETGYEKSNGTILVTTEELKTEILTWWETYSKRFIDVNRTLPNVEDGSKLNGTLITTIACTSGSMTDKPHAEWRWLNDNCEHDIKFVNGEFWLFEDETEALMFKLSKQ